MENKLKNRTKLEKLREWMKYKKYSENTISTYCSHLRQIFIYFDKDSSNISSRDLYNMISDLNNTISISETKHNHLVSSFRLYMYVIHWRKINERLLQRPKKARKLPEILSEEEIGMVINSITNLKHKSIIAFIYLHGLRISECINFKLSDFDKSSGVIHVRGGKGRKDRYIEFNPFCREILKQYYEIYKPKEYLFDGQNTHYSATSIRKILKASLERCGIKKDIHVHSLRHSFATHMFDNGTDLAKIQLVLGHSSPKSTRIYTKISTRTIKGLYQLRIAV